MFRGGLQRVTVSGTGAGAIRRCFGTRRRQRLDIPKAILDALPYYPEEDVPEPEGEGKRFQDAFPANPVSSAHMIDVKKGQLSALDSVMVTPKGKHVHGRYGDLGKVAEAIPLEYLALLGPAAEGAAALRVLLEKNTKHKGVKGTIMVYGASKASGITAAQLASTAGHATVAIVDGDHSGNEDMMECIKALMAEPGTAICEEYTLKKKLFSDLVDGISKGDEGIKKYSPEVYLEDFKQNFIDYCEFYPDTRPAAVSEEHLKFKYMEKDREFWEENMRTYLEQFPPGAPPVDKAKLDAFFTTEQYQIFRQKFWIQTTDVISGGDEPFSAPHVVQNQILKPEKFDHTTHPGAGPFFPYSFNILNSVFPEGTSHKVGGPVLGAIIVVNDRLQKTMERVSAEKTLRGKAEALQFLSQDEKAAYCAARGVAAKAQAEGAPVVIVGGTLPGMETVKATKEDVQEALSAMDIDEEGKTRLNFYVQAYRANNFPFYADYAIHRASEPLAGPRQIIVTK